ncbi:MAG TPA: hypothetical protein VFA57_08825 [Pseudolabrys sp.]|nr:hypothetical protein [Pseudolabrys sp.]
MNFKIVIGAAALSLATIGGASAQEVYVTEPAYVAPPVYAAPVAPAPAYVVPAPGYVVSEPAYVAPPYAVPAPPPAPVPSPYYEATYAAPAACTVDIYGNRYCD